jgi:hypothetical protein
VAKKQLLLRIDPALWEEINRWAADEFRSVNGQIEYLLHRAVRERKRGGKSLRDGESRAPNASGDGGGEGA